MADFVKIRMRTETLLHLNVWWWIGLPNLTSLKPPLSVSVEKLMNRISSNFTYTETYPSAMDTENLKYLCGLVLAGIFNKMVKVKDSKVALHRILSEFGLETLSHLIANFSAVNQIWLLCRRDLDRHLNQAICVRKIWVKSNLKPTSVNFEHQQIQICTVPNYLY